MKGLLIKDVYMVNKYCRPLLLILLLFLIVSCFGNESLFFTFYPILVATLIPVTLVSYDEREKWNVYSLTLPYTKKDFVTSKYVLGFFFIIGIIILSGITQVIRMNVTDSFTLSKYFTLLIIMFFIGVVGPSVLLPFIFKFGAEKGRLAYYIVIAVICALVTVISGSTSDITTHFNKVWILALLIVSGIIIYLVSWLISIKLYNKREL